MVQTVQLPDTWKNVSVSSGTQLTDDVFQALDRLNLVPENLKRDYEAVADCKDKLILAELVLWEDIFDYLNTIAPVGCLFGAHPGDGCDYGFWEYEKYTTYTEDGAADDNANQLP
jgi:hypothetical protein